MSVLDVIVNQATVTVSTDVNFGPSSVGASVALAQVWADQHDGRNAPLVLAAIPSFLTADGVRHSTATAGGTQVQNNGCAIFGNNVTRVTFSLTATSETAGQVFGKAAGTIYFFD